MHDSRPPGKLVPLGWVVKDMALNVEPIGARILLVEDPRPSVGGLSAMLRDRGYTVVHGTDLSEPLDLLEGEAFDLIILDLNMHDETKLVSILLEIRSEHSESELPILVVADDEHSREVVAALSAGASEFVARNVEPAVLWTRVRTQLQLKFLNELKDELFSDPRVA
jgi:DNA-binding response OmpR family regulator